MFKTYLSTDKIIYSLIITVLIFIFLNLWFNLAWFICFGFMIYAYRKKKLSLKDNTIINNDLIIAPISGYVSKIEKADNCSSIYFKSNYLSEFGLYYPINGETTSVIKSRGKTFFRWGNLQKLNFEADKTWHQNLIEISSVSHKKISLNVYKCPTGLRPEISLLGGDRGKVRACFGFLPFGGTIVLKIFNKCDILVDIGNFVDGGETLIAKFNQN